MTSLAGLSSGLDTNTIISQLMQIERLPQDRLVTQRTAERSAQTELKGIRSEVSSLGDFASDLRRSSQWLKLSATSTDNSVVATASSGEVEGSFSFEVSALATSHTVYSNDIYSDLTETSETSGSVFSYRDTAVLGIESMQATGLEIGEVDFSVTQATSAATIQSGPIPTIPVTINATNDQLGLEVEGIVYQITLDEGEYDSEQALANALNTAISAHGDLNGIVKAKLGDDDRIELSTVAEGSAHSLAITGGTAADLLGFTPGPAAVGTDGIISINGDLSTISDTSLDSFTLPTSGDPAGPTITLELSGGLREGTADVEQINFGDGSLSDIVSTINSATGLNYSAAAINTGSGYRLQLVSKDTGADAVIDADLASVAGPGGFSTLTEGSDAELTVQGVNPYTVTSSSNDFSDVMPGLDIEVTAITEDPVTVSVSRDRDYVADQISELVDRVNSLTSRIGNSTTTEPGGTRAILQGNRSARTAQDQIANAMIRPVEASSIGSLGSAGIQIELDGTLSFDRTKFLETLKDNPDELTRLFAQSSVGEEENGVLDRLVESAEAASSFGEGYLYTAAESAGNRIESYSDQIEAYEVRLELREQTIRRTYANLEVLLGEMQRQSSQLSSQLGGLS